MTEEEHPEDGQALSNAALPKLGDLLVGKYRIEKVVGEGGMGVVYAARHEALDQLVAVKVLLADAAKGEGVIERFVREAQAAARLQSEHVARVFDAGSLHNDVPFLVMEYLEGCDLEELLKIGGGALPVTDACDYVLQALAAMAQAHAVGIIHRDLKPANLFLAVRPDGSNVIKILDFGISKQTAASGREKALTGRAVLGSPAYMPPEQLRNAKSVDARADIWSLGIVLYEMLSGAPPFDGEGVGEIFAAILEKDPPSVRAKRPEIPSELEAVVRKALQRKPEDRWQDVAEFANALAPFCSPRWAQLVQTIESTLARSMQLRALQTPDTRMYAGHAGGERPTLAEDPGGHAPSAKVAFTRTDTHLAALDGGERAPRGSSETGKRARTWLLAAATGLALFGVAGVAARGYLAPRVARSPLVTAPASPADVAPPPIAPAAAAAPDPAPEPSIVSVPRVDTGDAGVRPSTTTPGRGRRPSARPAATGSSRPKFLNSRE